MRSEFFRLLILSIAGAGLCASHARAQTPSNSVVSVATASSATPAPAGSKPLPTTEEILRKFQGAIGEREITSRFTTRSMKGIYQFEDLSTFAGIEVTNKAPNQAFTKITFANGVTVREICDGKSVWLEDPTGRLHDFTGAALESRLRQARFNHRAEIMSQMVTGRVFGTAQVGTHSTYVVEFSPSKKIDSKVYFDADTGYAVRADDTLHQEDGDYVVQTFMDDYRPVDGAYYPFKIRHVEKGSVFTLRITQIKNDPAVDDSIFVKPGPAPAKP